MPIKTTIVMADDHLLVRDGMAALLKQQADMDVVALASNGREAVDLVIKHRPRVLVTDIGMGDLNGTEAARQIISEAPQTKIVAVSMHADRQYVSQMLLAGASAYLLKENAVTELVAAIRAVIADEYFFSPRVLSLIIREYLHLTGATDGRDPSPLTAKEREVLQLLAEGCSTKDMAERLFVSVKTIDTHRQRIMGKLALHTIPELTKYAIREGLTSIDQ